MEEVPEGIGGGNAEEYAQILPMPSAIITENLTNTSGTNTSLTRKNYAKKKCVIIFGYLGCAYQGSQRNPGAKTVENSMMDALCKIGAIDECNAGSYNKVNWDACARTDKGVSAVANVISLSLRLVPDIVEKLNDALPIDIRAFAVHRVSKRFCCRSRVDGRRYVYTMPAQLFSITGDPVDDEHSIQRIKNVLCRFLGSHNYHHFTSSMEYHKPQAYRVVRSFDFELSTDSSGMKWITFTILGQSFLLNQIRKIIALVLCVIKDDQPLELVDCLFTNVSSPGIHMAPAEGLFLQSCIFDTYNASVEAPNKPLVWNEQEHELKQFRDQVIMNSIHEKQLQTQVFTKWIEQITEFPINYERILREGTELLRAKEQSRLNKIRKAETRTAHFS